MTNREIEEYKTLDKAT